MPSSGVQTCALRSEEHTSELQSHDNLVSRLLLEKQTHDQIVVLQPAPDVVWAGPVHVPVEARQEGVRLPGGALVAEVFFFKYPPPPGIHSRPQHAALPI